MIRLRIRRPRKRSIGLAIGTLAASFGLAAVLAGPAAATTQLDIVNAATNFVACGTTGNLPEFVTSSGGCYQVTEDFNIQPDGSYYIHPHGSDNYCLTQSTTQESVVKEEPCANDEWQDWYDVLCNASDLQYVWENEWDLHYVRNPGGASGGVAVTTSIGGCGTASELLRQVPV